jgi:ParB/RepB/Spo0J family partition protein
MSHYVQNMPLESLHESKSNPRKHFDETKLQELADSIYELGVLEPILVREDPAGGFEIVCGHRRVRAARLAESAAVPAIVKHLSDQEALEAQLVENGQRTDPSAIEEADGFRMLMELYQQDVAAIATKVGKSASYVRARLKLCELSEIPRNALLEGRLPLGVALAIARIPQAVQQAEATVEVLGLDDEDYGQAMTAAEATAHIQAHYMQRLAGAIFDTTDATLVPAAGVCTLCPKRSGAQPELFGDVDDADTCTDVACFRSKEAAVYALRISRAEATGQRILSADETKAILPSAHGLSYFAPYVDLDTVCLDDPMRRTWRELAGKRDDVVIAKSAKSARVYELLSKTVTDEILVAVGITVPQEEDDDAAADRAAERARWKVEHEKSAAASELRMKVAEIAVAELAKAANAGELAQKDWLFLLLSAALATSSDLGRVCERRGIETSNDLHHKEALLAAAREMGTDELRSLLVEVMISRVAFFTYRETHDPVFIQACDLYGVDLASLERKAKKAQAPKGGKKKAAAS